MKRCYAAMLVIYPPAYRHSFGSEMAAVFVDASHDQLVRGWVSYLTFLFAELAGLLYGAAIAWNVSLREVPSVSRTLWFGAGAMVSLPVLRGLLSFSVLPEMRNRWQTSDEAIQLAALAAISVVLIAAFLVAFVVNLRLLAARRQSQSRL